MAIQPPVAIGPASAAPAATGTHNELLTLDADATLTAAAASARASQLAEVEVLALAAHWADLHGHLAASRRSTALPGAEQLVQFGGDGTPAAAEFAPAEFGANLGLSVYSATALIADALDLRHRLPALWAMLRAGSVKPWVGRKIAQSTRSLTRDAAHVVDAKVAPWADRLTWTRLEEAVHGAIIAVDPDRAEAEAELARSGNGFWLSREIEHGTRSAYVRAEAVDLDAFDVALDRVADSLAELGDATSRDVRRARGLGILADPQQALDLSACAVSPASTKPMAAPTSGQAVCLFVHISADALGDDPTHQVARVEGIGAATLGQVKRWLGDKNVILKPVVDPAGIAPVDAYEIPDRLREAVHLTAPADAFPYASSLSRRTDLDHTEPYEPGGPPGQTRPGNLAKLTRRHHRIKTHGRWQVRQPYPGVVIWRSPHGRMFLVDQTGTRHLN